MPQDFEKIILERLTQPGWITTRGVLRDPTGQADPDDYLTVEEVMKEMAVKGTITLWKLTLEEGGKSIMAAVRPGMELNKELEQRNATATAERYPLET